MQVDLTIPPDARKVYEEVVGLPAQGASPRGSTYYRRLQLCPREHLLANKVHWERLPRADALDIGLLWHGCKETYRKSLMAIQNGHYRPSTPEQDAFYFLQRFRDAKGWDAFYDCVSRMLEAYFTRWQSHNEWHYIAVEWSCGWTKASHPEIVAQLGFEITTRLDAVVIDHSFAPVVRHIETKSARALDPVTVQGYGQDDQILGQAFLAKHAVDWQALGYPPYVGGIVDITTKAKEPKCERLPVAPDSDQLGAWMQSKRYWYWQEQQYEAYGYPKNYANCTRRFGRCQFFDYCRGYPTEDLVQIRTRTAKDDLPFGYQLRALPVLDATEE